MKNFTRMVAGCLCSLTLGMHALARAQADPPLLDFGHPAAYHRALERSPDPESAEILQEITNGPADLAAAQAALKNEPPEAGTPLPAPRADIDALYQRWTTARRLSEFSTPLYANPLMLQRQYTPAQIAAVQEAYDSYPDVDALLMDAVNAPVTGPVPGSSFRFSVQYREAAREIATQAVLLADQGRWTDAVAMQANGFKIEAQAAAHNSLMGYLVSLAIDNITIKGLQGILAWAPPSADTAEAAAAAVEAAADTVSVRRCLEGDLKQSAISFEQIKNQLQAPSTGPGDTDGGSAADHTFVVDLYDAERARYLRQMQAALAVVDEAPLQRRADLEALLKKADAPYSRIKDDPFGGGPFDSGQALMLADVRLAREQVTLAAASVLAVKARTGSFPAVLPGAFTDPFSGSTPIYKAAGQGFVLYSVGPTGHFDGTSQPGLMDPETSFQYPAPPKTSISAILLP